MGVKIKINQKLETFLEYRGFKYTAECAEDLKNTLDIDIISLIDNYHNNNVSSLVVTVGYRTYNIDIKDNNINVVLKSINQ